jgi:hypothetical protein
MSCLRSLGRSDLVFESHLRHGCLYFARIFCVCVVLCVGRGFAMGWSPSKECYQLCIGSRNWKRGQGPAKGYRAIIIINMFWGEKWEMSGHRIANCEVGDNARRSTQTMLLVRTHSAIHTSSVHLGWDVNTTRQLDSGLITAVKNARRSILKRP